jgi:hypothetical protein
VPEEPRAPLDDDAIRALVTRLSRKHPSGGKVIERAAILAEGVDSAAVLRWIAEHDGVPEDLVAATSGHGLHGGSFQDRGGTDLRKPLRFVLPPGALG